MAEQKELLEVADSDLDGEELVVAKAVRKDGECLLYVKASESISDLVQNGTSHTSGNWKNPEGDNHEFYKKRNLPQNVKDVTNSYYNDYGSSMAASDDGNIAFLRTEGIEEGRYFDADRPLTEENLKNIVRDIKQVVDDLRNQFLKDMVVVGEVREVDVQNDQKT